MPVADTFYIFRFFYHQSAGKEIKIKDFFPVRSFPHRLHFEIPVYSEKKKKMEVLLNVPTPTTISHVPFLKMKILTFNFCTTLFTQIT